MITVKEVDKSFFESYDKVAMNVDVHSEYRVKRVLSKIDMYAYYSEPEIKNEIQLIWYLDI